MRCGCRFWADLVQGYKGQKYVGSKDYFLPRAVDEQKVNGYDRRIEAIRSGSQGDG